MEENKELTKEELMRFAEFIRRRRLELNLTQNELAQLVFGEDKASRIGDLEIGRRLPTYQTMIKVLKGLNCSLEFIRNETK